MRKRSSHAISKKRKWKNNDGAKSQARSTHRDREAPHSAPLPHHRAYGTVHGGSAGQASDFQGYENSSLVPESVP